MGEYRAGHRDGIVLPREAVQMGDLISFGGVKYTVIQVGDWSDIYDRVMLDRPLEDDIYTQYLKVVGVFQRLAHEKITLTLRVRSLEEEMAAARRRLWKLAEEMAAACLQEGGHFDNGAMFHGFCTRCGECLG